MDACLRLAYGGDSNRLCAVGSYCICLSGLIFFAIATISQRHDTATMVPRRFDKRWLFVASAIASIGYVVCWFSSESVSRLSDLPIAGEEFRSAPMPLNPQETQAIGDAIAIRRWYQFKSTQAIVTVVDGTLNRHAIHDLLYCVRGAGWEICSDQPLDLPCGAGRMITSRKGDEEAVLVYWFSDRKVRHGSFLKYRLQTALRRITAGKSGLEPYLIVIQSCGQQPADWRELLAPDSPFFLYLAACPRNPHSPVLPTIAYPRISITL